jgi:transposase
MEIWAEVRRRVLAGEISKRHACREYHLHWDTLRKILEHAEPPGYRRREPRPKPTLGPFLPVIHQILEADPQAPKKQRHTARRIFDRLREEHGYAGCESIVRAAVADWKKATAEVFVPLSHPPGEAQVDFGHAEVVVAGERVTAAFFVMTLPHSDAFFVRAFPKECTESFQDGHVQAFEYFGGVPTRISYDNSKVTVAAITGSRGRTPTREFLRLASHFLFAYRFCRVRRPNEKGHVEAMVGFARRNFLVPVPAAGSWEALNAELARRCRDDLPRRVRGKERPKGELLAAEACRRGKRVRFWRVTELVTQLLEAREERVLLRLKAQLARLDLLVLDELGYVPTSKVGAELLFDVISTAYERTSVVVTTNLPFEQWTEVLGSERVVGATLDRLTHRCHILEASGESYRLRDAKRRQGSGSSPKGRRREPADSAPEE